MVSRAQRRLVETRRRGWVDPGATRFDFQAFAPSPALAPFADHFWISTWDLAEPFEQRIVSHPTVNLTITEEFSRIAGVIRGSFGCRLEGAGRVVALRFRPGGFRPFLDGPVSQLTGRFVSLSDMYGEAGEKLTAEVLGADEEQAMEAVERFLLRREPRPDPVVDEVAALVRLAEEDRSLIRVDLLAEHAGTSVRSLQRVFNDYVGIGPKWVIRRFRLHEAAATMSSGEPVDLASLATSLGYTDQAHLTRDFTAAIGMPPAAYARAAT